MLFLTVALFVFNIVMLINGGSLFKNSLIKSGELQIKLDNKEITKKDFDEQALKSGCLVMGIGIPIMLIQFIYMIIAINHKELAIVSIAYFILYILWMFFASKLGKKKYDLTKEEEVAKFRKNLYRGRTFKSVLWNLISLTYFGYMAYLLLTIN